MDAAHHLARQKIARRDHKLERGEGDADGIGEMAPAARAKAFRKPVLEIVELDLDGRSGALGLQHSFVPTSVSDALPPTRSQ